MNSALKGILLSSLVFPGIGQIVFKRYMRGVLIILAVLLCMAVFVFQAVQFAETELENIVLQGGTVDNSTVANVAVQLITPFGNHLHNFYLILIFVIWIFGAIDAFRIGRNLDSKRVSD